jgi:hypothetical protein
MSCLVFTLYSMVAFFTSVTMPDTLVCEYVPEGPSLFYLSHVSIIPYLIGIVKVGAEAPTVRLEIVDSFIQI